MNSLLFTLTITLLVLSSLSVEGKKCKKPKAKTFGQSAKLVIAPALGNEIVNTCAPYNNYTGICTDCKKAGGTLFFPGQPSALNSNNAEVYGDLDMKCKDWSQACIKGKGAWYGVRGGDTGAISYVAIYTLCNSKGKKCKNYAQLACNLTKFDGSAGLYKLKGANPLKQKKAKWTCEKQQGATGTTAAPAISKKNKYILVKAVSCGGCKPIKKPGCKGPTNTSPSPSTTSCGNGPINSNGQGGGLSTAMAQQG